MNLVKLLLPLMGWSGLVGCQAYSIAANSSSSSISRVIDSGELVTNPCQEVRLAGFVCVDCSHLGFCAHVDGQWQTVAMTECQSDRGFYCSDEGTIGCTWQSKCQVPVRGKFYCQQPGVFPDPYDCRSYHECSEQNVDTPRQCTNGAAYSLLTASCSLPRESEVCSEKQYTCNYVGQTGVWPAHSSYFYVCQKEKLGNEDVYYPLMMKCSDGYSFNGHICVEDGRNRELTFACEEGISYPGDSKEEFYFCFEGEKIHQRCAPGFYFVPELALCVKDPDTCDEGMLYGAETKYGFNICVNGQLIYQRCPVGTYFDLEDFTCKKDEEQEPQRRSFRADCIHSEVYPAETDQGYLLCLHGELTYHECPEGSYFDAERIICMPDSA